MTKNQRRQFYNRLRAAKGKFNWFLDNNIAIRAKKPDRAIGKFCPITAICFSKTEKFFGALEADQQYVDVGIELEREDRENIMEAADTDKLSNDEEKVLRKTMLRILGLD